VRERGWLRAAAWGLLLVATLLSGTLGYYRAQAALRQMQLAEAARWLEGRVIVVDPGHGGHDPGAVVAGTEEKGLVLSIALVLKEMLQERGATVILTRETDMHLDPVIRRDLARRAELAERYNADALVSIHANKDTCHCWGAQTFHQRGDEIGKELAEAIQAQMRRLTPTTREVLPANFYLLRTARVPSALVEVGFLSHPEEVRWLQQPKYQRTLAEAMVLGLADFFRRQVPPARSEGELGR